MSVSKLILVMLIVLEEGKVSSYCSTLSHGVVCAFVLQHCGSWKQQLHFWLTVIWSS